MKIKTLILLLITSFILTGCTKKEPVVSIETGDALTTEEDIKEEKEQNKENLVDPLGNEIPVKITNLGFLPEKVIIKKGTTVKWTNNNDTETWVASDMHPTHDIYPELDQKKSMKKDEAYTFTFNKVGEWTYHDHLNPSFKGIVVVEE